MKPKRIQYVRTKNQYTLNKDSLNKREHQRLDKLMDQLLQQRGVETFKEFLNSYSAGARASAFNIGGRVKRRESFDNANEVNGEHVQIDFVIDFKTKQIEIETNLTEEGIDLELTLLNLHYYSEDGEKIPAPTQSKTVKE